MAGTTKLMTAGGGGVALTPASSIASDVTVNLPVTGVNNGTLVCSDSSGNVGIGTSSPAQKLHVVQTTDANTDGIRVARAGTPAQYGSLSNYGGATWLTASDTAAGGNNILVFNRYNGTTYSESARIDSSGRLLVNNIGNTLGYISVTQGAYYSLQSNTSSSGPGQGHIVFTVNGTAVGTITTSGSSTAYNTSSDYRLKENIQPMQGALAVVQQLNPVTYTWKADGSDGQGFIAHELQAVVPDCVTGEKDAVDADGNPVYQGIDTSFLVATLTKAIQEQQAQIETLTAKVAALEAK